MLYSRPCADQAYEHSRVAFLLGQYAGTDEAFDRFYSDNEAARGSAEGL